MLHVSRDQTCVKPPADHVVGTREHRDEIGSHGGGRLNLLTEDLACCQAANTKIRVQQPTLHIRDTRRKPARPTSIATITIGIIEAFGRAVADRIRNIESVNDRQHIGAAYFSAAGVICDPAGRHNGWIGNKRKLYEQFYIR